MFDSPLRAEALILVSLGSVFGAYLRFSLITLIQSKYIHSYLGVFFVNILACFLLGFSISFLSNFNYLSFANQLHLFFSIGFLGSFSTFSSYIFDVFSLFVDKKFKRGFALLLLSIIVGIIFASMGYLLGI